MLTGTPGAIFATIVVAVAALGMGGWIWRKLPSSFSWFDRLACTWLGGLGVLGTVLFLVGQFAFTRVTIFLTLTVAVATAINFLARRRRADYASYIRQAQIPWLPAIVIALVLLVTVLGGLAEITGELGKRCCSLPFAWAQGLAAQRPNTPRTGQLSHRLSGNGRDRIWGARRSGRTVCSGLLRGSHPSDVFSGNRITCPTLRRGQPRRMVGCGFSRRNAGCLHRRAFWFRRCSVREFHFGCRQNRIRGAKHLGIRRVWALLRIGDGDQIHRSTGVSCASLLCSCRNG